MCACFQKRTRENNKIESLKIGYVPITDMKKWSITLGFKGETGEDFYKKYDSVIEVRKNIVKELYYGFLGTASFLAIFVYGTYNDMVILSIPSIIFTGLSCFSIYAHSKVIFEWKRHDKEMMKVWMEQN
jgi:hypothetical protein